jgi:hypothetical protein
MSNELARYEGDLPLADLGKVLASSGYFSDTRDAAQAIVRVLAGRELGIGPISAMTGVYIVKGRVAIGANLMAAAVKRSGKYNYRVVEMSDAVCKIAFTEHGKDIGESVFTLADAKKAGTQNLDKFPRNMLFARAMSNGVRWFCPDVFDTAVYTPDELRSSDHGQGATYEHAPPAPPVNTVTGEVLDEAPPPPPPDERGEALAAMRRAWKAAKEAGCDNLATPAPSDVAAMSIEDLRLWTATYHAEHERVIANAIESVA